MQQTDETLRSRDRMQNTANECWWSTVSKLVLPRSECE